jgi:hypothetical protein
LQELSLVSVQEAAIKEEADRLHASFIQTVIDNLGQHSHAQDQGAFEDAVGAHWLMHLTCCSGDGCVPVLSTPALSLCHPSSLTHHLVLSSGICPGH